MRKNIFIIFLFTSAFMAAQNWDANTLKKINRWDSGFVKGYSRVMSNTTLYIANGIPLGMAIYGGVTKNEKLLKDAVYIGTTVVGAIGVTYGLKYVVGRERPFDKYPDLIEARTYESSPSFPSSHTAAAFSLATSLSITYPKWYVIAPSAVWATSVGFARMNQGVHYPSDVIVGAVMGSGAAVVNIYVNRWLNNWLFPAKKKEAALFY